MLTKELLLTSENLKLMLCPKPLPQSPIYHLRPRPHVPGYFRIRNFFFSDTATVHTYPANSTANPEKNKSALQSGKKYIRNESDNVWTGPKSEHSPFGRVIKIH